MDLRTIKLIKNGYLPGFLFGEDDEIMKRNPINDYLWDLNYNYLDQTETISKKPAPKRTVLTLSISPQKEQLNNPILPITKSGIADFTGNWITKKIKSPNISDSAASNIGPWFALGSWAGGGLLDGINSSTSYNELLLNAGKSTSSINGISYDVQNGINEKLFMDLYDAETNSSLLTNPFRFIGRSLFGRDSQKEELRKFNMYKTSHNEFAKSSAATKALQYRSSLKGYSLGKEPVETSYGFLYGIEPNARGDYGEIIKNMTTGVEHKIKAGKGKIDGALINVKPTDVILSKKTGAADYYENTGDINGAIAMNKTMRQLIESGKLPGFKLGYLPNIILHGIEGLTALGDYLNIKNLPVKKVNTYAGNTYEGLGLKGLAGLHYSKIPVLNLLSNMRAASDYTLRNSGASSAQQYWGSVANTANMYKAIADLNTNLQEKNIGLKSNYYTQALNVGAQNAQRRQAANLYDEEFFAKGHGAKTKMGYQRLSDIFNIGQSALANDAKLRMYNNMLSNYLQDGEIPAGLFNPSDAYYKYRRLIV